MIVDGIEMYIRLESSRIDVAHTVQKHRCYCAGFMHLRLRLNEAQRGIFVLYVVIHTVRKLLWVRRARAIFWRYRLDDIGC